MSDPVIAKKGPFVVDLKAGEYWYCTCGRSASQPFCDGSHKGTGFAPQKITVAEDRKAGLCGCRQSGNAPFCDGSHKKL